MMRHRVVNSSRSAPRQVPRMKSRKMEFVLAAAQALPWVDPARLGVIGYDLDGMAGLVLGLRDPAVRCFLSLDAGILDRHFSGLPFATHSTAGRYSASPPCI